MPNQIGTQADKVPASQQLGRMAFQNPEAVVLQPQPSASPMQYGDMVFQLSSNTSLTIKVRGTDGVTRAATLTLA